MIHESDPRVRLDPRWDLVLVRYNDVDVPHPRREVVHLPHAGVYVAGRKWHAAAGRCMLRVRLLSAATPDARSPPDVASRTERSEWRISPWSMNL